MKKRLKKIFIGIDVGGTKLLAALIRENGKVLFRKKISTPPSALAHIIAKKLISLIADVKEEGRHHSGRLSGIGIGIPGIVSPDGKEILRTPNIQLSNYPLYKKIKEKFKVRLAIGNDVNCGLLGEYWLGAARGAKNIIGIFPGTGVGGAIILNGKLFTGSQGAAGEFGHMIMDYNSKLKHAGVIGSLEALTSRRAIEREIRNAFKKNEKTIITKYLEGDLKIIKSKILAKALKKRDRVVARIIKDVGLILGQACISLRHIFNPDMIVFGGGLIEACGGYILPYVRIISQRDPFFKGIDHCEIVPSELGDDAVILGTVKLVKDS